MVKKKLAKLISIITTATIVLSLTGCGSKNDGANQDKTGNSQQTVTLKFANWGQSEDSTKAIFQKMADDFTAQNPNIKIEFVSYPYGDIQQQVLVTSNAGNAPDVVQGETAAFASYMSSGYVQPLDSLVDKKIIDDMYPGVKDSVSYDGKVYALPWIASPYVMVYNKDLFTKAGLDPNSPPKTYADMIKAAEAIAKLKDASGNSVYGLGETTASVAISGDAILSSMFSFGGGLYDKSGNLSVNTPENIAAFNFYKDLETKKLNPQAGKLKDLRNLMAIGRLGMYFDQIWGVSGVFSINANIKSNIALAPMPATDKTNGLSLLESHQLMVMKDSKHLKESVKFIEFLTSKEELKQYVQVSSFLSGFKSINEDPAMLSDFTKPVKDSLNGIKALEKVDPNQKNALLELTNAAQAVTVGGSTAEAAVKNLDTKLKDILKK
jgi:multiple sugar transport system substrate-binding protein